MQAQRIQTETTAMEKILKKAIKERMVVQFTSEERKEVVEPFIIGYKKYSNTLMLLGYRILSDQNERPWKLFAINEISDLTPVELKAYSYRGGIIRYTNKFDTIVTSISTHRGEQDY